MVRTASASDHQAIATREGQTRRIAEHIAAELGAQHIDVELIEVKTPPVPVDWLMPPAPCGCAPP